MCFTKQGYIANSCVEMWSKLLVPTIKPILTRMREHHIPIRITKNMNDTKCQRAYEVTKTIMQEGKMAQPLGNIIYLLFVPLSIYVSFSTMMPFLGIYTRERKTCAHINSCASCLQQHYTSLPTPGNKPKVSLWMNK